MKTVIIGQKWFGAQALTLAGDHAAAAIAPDRDDRLAIAASARGLPVYCLDGGSARSLVLPDAYDLLIAAHAHCYVPAALRAQFTYSVGYHPSLLPLHRGRHAVAATVAAGDKVTGGTIYHLDYGYDTGAVAFQDWCFVPPGISAADLWRDRLAPLGLELIEKTIGHMEAFGFLPRTPQRELT